MNFNDIKGHKVSIKIILDSINNQRMANAYLFSGPEGSGKSLVAKCLAKKLNCLNNLDGCEACSACVKIEHSNHPDVHWIEKDSSGFIKIEAIRQLEREIYLKPYEARKKVFIILEAQNLTEEASNALLKTLEEPPLDTLLILTTSHSDRLLDTITSRCQKIRFSRLNVDNLKETLIKDYKLEQNLAIFLSYFSEGNIGRAIKFKDKDFLVKKNRIIDNFLNPLESSFIDNFSFEEREEIKYSLDVLLNWFRDILVFKIGATSLDIVNIDRRKEISFFKNIYSLENLIALIEDIFNLQILLRQNLNIKIPFYLMRLKLWKG